METRDREVNEWSETEDAMKLRERERWTEYMCINDKRGLEEEENKFCKSHFLSNLFVWNLVEIKSRQREKRERVRTCNYTELWAVT